MKRACVIIKQRIEIQNRIYSMRLSSVHEDIYRTLRRSVDQVEELKKALAAARAIVLIINTDKNVAKMSNYA